jgi:hypothetical protein
MSDHDRDVESEFDHNRDHEPNCDNANDNAHDLDPDDDADVSVTSRGERARGII